MKKFENNDKKIIKMVNEKLIFIIDQLDNETNSELIFFKKEIFLNVINLLKEIYELMENIFNPTEDMIKIHNAVIVIEDIIEINMKHYGESVNF